MANGSTYLARATSSATAYGVVAIGDIDADANIGPAYTAAGTTWPLVTGGTGASASPLVAEIECVAQNPEAIVDAIAYMQRPLDVAFAGYPFGLSATGGISDNADPVLAESSASAIDIAASGGTGDIAGLPRLESLLWAGAPYGVSAAGGSGAIASILGAEAFSQAVDPQKSAGAAADIYRADSSSAARPVPTTGGISAEAEMVPAESEASTYEMDITAGTGANVVIYAEISLAPAGDLDVDGGIGATASPLVAEAESGITDVTATGSTNVDVGIQPVTSLSVARQTFVTGGTGSSAAVVPAQSIFTVVDVVATGGISANAQPSRAASLSRAAAGSVVGTSGATIQMPRASAAATVVNVLASGDVIPVVPGQNPDTSRSNYLYINGKMIRFKASDVRVVVGGQWKSAASMKISHNGKWGSGA